MEEIYKNISISMYDTDTGEQIYKSLSRQILRSTDVYGTKTIRCAFDSFLRGLLANRNISIHIDITPVDNSVEGDLF